MTTSYERTVQALKAIAEMHTDGDTDYRQLYALCAAVALTTLKEIEVEREYLTP